MGLVLVVILLVLVLLMVSIVFDPLDRWCLYHQDNESMVRLLMDYSSRYHTYFKVTVKRVRILG